MPQAAAPSPDAPRRRGTAWVVLALLLAGVALRTHRFAEDRALWRDEAMLALGVRDLAWDAPFAALPYHQAAPPAYVVLTKAVTDALGRGERAQRLLPFLASLASLFLFRGVARRTLPGSAGLVALAAFALSPALVRYAGEAKPYAVDAAAATLVAWIVVRLTDVAGPGTAWGRPWVLAPLSAFLVTLSFPAAMVVGAASLVLLARRPPPGGPRLAWAGLALGGAAVATTAALYVALYRGLAADPYVDWFWAERRAPLPWPPTAARWYLASAADFFAGPLALGAAGGAGLVVALAGLLRARAPALRPLGLLGIGTAGLTLAASAGVGYPVVDRFLLFLVPGTLWVFGLACGVEGRGDRALPWALAALPFVLGPPLFHAARAVVAPPPAEDARAVLQAVRPVLRRGDVVYLHLFLEPLARWYAPDLWDESRGLTVVAPPEGDVRWLDGALLRPGHAPRLRGHARVWLVDTEDGYRVRWFLDEIGRRDESAPAVRGPGYAALLYDTR